MGTTYSFFNQPTDAKVLFGQTIDSDSRIGYPVYFDGTSWHKATSNSNVPQGIMTGVDSVTLFGRAFIGIISSGSIGVPFYDISPNDTVKIGVYYPSVNRAFIQTSASTIATGYRISSNINNVQFTGNNSIDVLYVDPSVFVIAYALLGNADKVFLPDNVSNYTFSLDGNVITITHNTTGGGAQISDSLSLDTVIFSDGYYVVTELTTELGGGATATFYTAGDKTPSTYPDTLITIDPLTPGSYYFLAPDGGLTTDVTNTKIGVAISATELLVDIDSTASYSSGTGYILGSYTTTVVSTINKFDFISNTVTTLSTNLTYASEAGAGFASSIAGYRVGGSGSSGRSSMIDKLTFSNDTNSASGSWLNIVMSGSSGLESTINGYSCGGYNGSYFSFINKIVFSNDSRSLLGSYMNTNSQQHAQLNSSDAGYTAGGMTGSLLSSFNKLTFSNEAVSLLSTYLGLARRYPGGVSSSNAGYSMGGWISSGVSSIDKFLFSSETNAVISLELSYPRETRGLSGKGAGYSMGGWYINAAVSFIEGLDFDTDTSVSVSTTLIGQGSGVTCFTNKN